MQRWYTAAFALTTSAACGSGPVVSKPPPLELVSPVGAPHSTALLTDAAVPDAAPLPKLACDPGTTIMPAAFPEPTLYCVRASGERHGPFTTWFPDGTPEITGTYKDDKLDGEWRRNHPSGSVAEQGQFIAGLKHGTWRQFGPDGLNLGEYELAQGTGIERQWYDDGPLYSEQTLKDGMAAGTYRLFDHNGGLVVAANRYGARYDGAHVVGNKATLRLEETLHKGLRTGVRRLWSFGATILDEAYDRAGKLDGGFASWRDRKTLRIQGKYAHGKRVGLWTWLDRYGSREREGHFLAGKKTGQWTEWVENKLASTGNYSDDKPDGEFVHYDKTGNVLGRFTITNGTGTMMTFHGNRQVATRQQLVNGMLDGLYQEFTVLGKVVVEGRYVRDRKHGWWREWTEGGGLTLEQQWQRGKLDGVVKKYDGGKLRSEAHYASGKAVGTYTEYRNGKPSLTGQFNDDRRSATWTSYDSDANVVLIATYKDGVLDGPWKQLMGGMVIEGEMVAGRRSGTWSRTDRAGVVSTTFYRPDSL